MKTVYVSAGILINNHNQILMTNRPAGKSMAGQWEFPGGKIEVGETEKEALFRELKEELGIEINYLKLSKFDTVEHSYEDFNLNMVVFICYDWSGLLTMKEQQKMSWLNSDELKNLDIIDADLGSVKKIIETLI